MIGFQRYFCFERADSINKHAYYTWIDSHYANYMCEFLQKLTPINCIYAGDVWAHELDDVCEVLFLNQSSRMGMGYEINKQNRFPIEVSGCVILGSFEVSYDRRSQFLYKATTDIEGYFMKKNEWKSLN